MTRRVGGVCAVARRIAVMTAARFVQGFAGGWAMVIGRAVIIDLATRRPAGPGAERDRRRRRHRPDRRTAARRGDPAAVATGGSRSGPSPPSGVAMTIAVLVAVPESLPPERRHAGGLRTFVAAGREVLGNRRYVGYLIVSGSAMGALFAYVATSAFVLQSMNGLSPIAYSIDFAANAAGMTSPRWSPPGWPAGSPPARSSWSARSPPSPPGSRMLIGAVWFDTPLLVALVCFFVLMTAQGLIGPNGGALASAEVPEHPGTGSAAPRLRPVGRRRHHRPHRRPRWRAHRRPDGRPHGRHHRRLHDRTAGPRPTRCVGSSRTAVRVGDADLPTRQPSRVRRGWRGWTSISAS